MKTTKHLSELPVCRQRLQGVLNCEMEVTVTSNKIHKALGEKLEFVKHLARIITVFSI